MDEVDAGAVITVALGLGIVAVGTVLAVLGAAAVVGITQAIVYSSGPLPTGGWIAAIVIGVVAASPGAMISFPGMILVVAVFWGRLRGRWAYRRWEALREEDSVSSTRR